MKCLFIDDNTQVLGSIKRALRDNKNVVFAECHHVEEALHVIAEHQPDVIFLDHHLTDGGNEGFEIVDQVQGVKIYSTTTDSDVTLEYQRRGIENVNKMNLKKIKSSIEE